MVTQVCGEHSSSTGLFYRKGNRFRELSDLVNVMVLSEGSNKELLQKPERKNRRDSEVARRMVMWCLWRMEWKERKRWDPKDVTLIQDWLRHCGDRKGEQVVLLKPHLVPYHLTWQGEGWNFYCCCYCLLCFIIWVHVKPSPMAFQELAAVKLSHCTYHTAAMIH